MSEEQSTAPEQSNEGGNSGFTPPASQDELNKIISDRVSRERAKYADYGDLKAKAAKFDEQEQANKTEAQRLADEAATAKSEAETARAELIRYQVAAKHGITDADDIALFLTGTNEETLTKQAERLAARSEPTGPRSPRPDPNQGRSGAGGPRSTADSFAEFFKNSLPER